MSAPPRRVAALAAPATLALVFVPAGAASAHVHVVPEETAAGAWSALTFRVPTESDTASTVKVQVNLPQNTPFLSVSTRPVPGWTAKVTTAKLPKPATVDGTTVTTAPTSVTWTADASTAQIAPGEYQDFAVSAGPLSASGTLSFPATQTYSDGKVVRWNQATPADGSEPEYPAPQFAVTAAAPGQSTASSGAASIPNSGSASPASSSTDSTSTSPVAVAALAVSVVAALLAAAALVRSRRRPTAGAA